MIGTGAGTVGLEHQKFQDYIVDDVCRYYFELLPIMKDRPNVLPWFTNHGTEKDDTDDDESSSGEESIVEIEERSSSMLNESDVEVTKVTNNRNTSARKTSYDSTLDSFNNNTNSVDDDDCSYSEMSIGKNSKQSRSRISSDSVSFEKNTGSKKTVSINSSVSSSTKNTTRKLSPLNAKQMKKNIFKERNNQINSKKRRGKASINGSTPENEEREFFVQQRNIKMKFELEKHKDLKVQHDEKMELEKKKYKMHEQEMNIRLDNEKNKRILSKVEIFKARLEFKRQDPNISEEFLDLHFPMT
jgi:hypothetical protein